jgi:hypothetical protein
MVEQNNTQPTCFDCLNAIVSPADRSVGIMFPSIEDCKAVEISSFPISGNLDAEIEKELPKVCGKFSPRMVGKCSECGKVINQPVYSWEHWAACWDSEPVCSEECKAKRQKRFDAEMEETFGVRRI